MTRSGEPTEPPPFHLTEVDRQVLSQTDEEFTLHDWDDLKDIIGESFRRIPPSGILYLEKL